MIEDVRRIKGPESQQLLRWHRGVLLALGLLLSIISTQSAEGSIQQMADPSVRVPHGYAVVDAGRIHRYPWAALLFTARDRPCLELDLASEGLELCEEPSPVAVSSISTGKGSGERSVVGVVGTGEVRRLYLNILGRPDEMLRLTEVSQKQVMRAGVSKELRVAVRALYGPFCLRRYVAYGREGRRLFSSNRHACE
jgi:hypothetical protein